MNWGRIAQLLPAYTSGVACLQRQDGTQALAEFQKIIDNRNIVANSALYPPPRHVASRARPCLPAIPRKPERLIRTSSRSGKMPIRIIPILIEARKEYEQLK
jgi:hypothetical protein